jgi:Flp pilus assembly protein TadD
MRYMAALKDEAFVQKQLERSIRLFEDSTHSTDTETREAAFYTLSGLYMMNGEAGRALDAVEKLPQPDYDARMLKASILRQTGQAEEAEKLHQTCLWGYVRDAGLCLYSRPPSTCVG